MLALMRNRSAALLASRLVAIYLGFPALIYSGELGHDLIRGREPAVLARSFFPIVFLLGLAAVMWILAPRVADAFLRDPKAPPDQHAGQETLQARDVGAIAFAVAGLIIATQATPLLASTVQRLVGRVWNRDATTDLVAAITRIAIGAVVFLKARVLATSVLGPPSAGSESRQAP